MQKQTMYLLNKNDLQALLKKWSEKMNVYTPVNQNNDVLLLPYKENEFTLDYVNFTMPVKEYLFEQKEELFKWESRDGGIKTITPGEDRISSKLLFGVRACDAYGLGYMDKFYMGEFGDENYQSRRSKTYIAALNCLQPAESCFCSSTGVGPFAAKGYDLLLTPIADNYLVEAGTEKGNELIAAAGGLLREAGSSAILEKEELLKAVEGKFTRKVDLSNIREVLDNSFDNPIWNQLANACLGCTGCTSVCPTCTCFNVVEEKPCSDSGCTSGNRVRCWDSCQSDSFTRNAGGHNPRSKVSKLRYRIYDKLKYIEERFNLKGCTGCGRCTNVCPGGISVIETVETLSNEYKNSENAKVKEKVYNNKFEQGGQNCANKCESVYTPQIAIIKEIVQETRDIKRFKLQFEDKSLHETYKFAGQFFEITIFGVGEIAISIPFGPSQKDYFDFCVKKAGKVTSAMHNLKVGDRVGLRGPFGKGFPYEEIKGRDILIVGSGVGVAPVRTMIVRIIENKKEFGKLVIIASASSYEGLVYKEDLIEWSKIEGVKVLYALSKPTDKVDAYVGYINDLLPDLGLDWANTTSVLCATPRRIKAVAKDLMNLGMKGTDILTSLETHMRCGIGKCGHCKVGNKYMCVDGPVFNYEEMLELPPEF